MSTSHSDITDTLVASLEGLRFGPPAAYVYNPLVYARAAWDQYCERYGRGPKRCVLLGMNPGPFGMAQTGVPFGEVHHVKDWMGIEAPVGRPTPEHPKRPILGFATTRSEVSGARLWGWARGRFGTPEAFFASFFVLNYCPLVFMEAGGRNVVPEQLTASERAPLMAACDRALLESVRLLQPSVVIGVGKFAERRALQVLAPIRGLRVASVAHPSPASPVANRGWAPLMDAALESLEGPQHST